MKHTPGPWNSLTDHDRETIVSEHVNEYGNFIVTIVTRGDERMTEEDRANARLIAAAPELLEALKYVVKFHRDNDSGEGELYGRDYITTAISAIAKAEERE